MVQIIVGLILIVAFWPAVLVSLVVFGIIRYSLWRYYQSEEFLKIKKSISKYVGDCNDLNDHINEIWSSYKGIKHEDVGQATVIDTSNFNFKRVNYHKILNDSKVYNCSLQICRNAQSQPFVYLIKYFNLPPEEETLLNFESLLEAISSIEEGKKYLGLKKEEIMNKISSKIPWVVRKLDAKNLVKKLGFQDVKLNNAFYPSYTFRYVSAGGNSSQDVAITFNQDTTDRFIKYLNEKIKWRKSIAGQRALMTSMLRDEIKRRDRYTCKKCHNSLKKEPNLLLEIDHIKPLSKGGMTTKDNLQTLCWRCNRSKGAKIE